MIGPPNSMFVLRVCLGAFTPSPGVNAFSDSSAKLKSTDRRHRPVPGRVMISMRGPRRLH